MHRNISGKPQPTTVRLTDEGREALASAPAKLGEAAAINLALAPTQPRSF